ncbi:hypothetical protein M446_0806 [Methylobacterium sp. 4-46]|uniref:hypothetical protein n=1 Tax=unclassified Methylobacterium TaxID=2615210 RepID=UPI000165C87F|nr:MULTISPECIES: hypothetical protein [Methylobacterium]ACA15360.1 hypothetical protein M446_0806 [Methylobacterium sp. 4-46]WFT81082.1 hypothetical protein QA634_04040 [Methylobacterium nodulans]
MALHDKLINENLEASVPEPRRRLNPLHPRIDEGVRLYTVLSDRDARRFDDYAFSVRERSRAKVLRELALIGLAVKLKELKISS